MNKITIRELAEKTGLFYYQIYFLIKRGLLPAEKIKVGKKIVYFFDKGEALKEIEKLKNRGIIKLTTRIETKERS